MARRRRRRMQSEMIASDDIAMSNIPANPADEDYAEDMSEGGYEDDAEEDAALEQREPMSEEEYQSRIMTAVQSAEDYIDTFIAPQRVQAAEYYRGAPFGDEEDGRSQIVLSEVRDTIQSILPSLMRKWLGRSLALPISPSVLLGSNVRRPPSWLGSLTEQKLRWQGIE